MTQQPTTTPAVPILNAAAMREQAAAAPDWLVSGLVPSQAVVVLAGTPGVGKSFTALSWAARVAEGGDWFGRKCRQAGVVYVLGEGFRAFGRRVAAWEDAHGPLPESVGFLDGGRAGVDLCDAASVGRLIEQLRAFGSLGLVVLDTFSMLASVSNENDNAEVARAMRGASRIVEELGASVVLVHHVAKASGMVRGATSFRGNADAVVVAAPMGEGVPGFMLSTHGEDDGKQRDGEPTRVHGLAVVAPGVLGQQAEVVQRKAAGDQLAELMAGAAAPAQQRSQFPAPPPGLVGGPEATNEPGAGGSRGERSAP